MLKGAVLVGKIMLFGIKLKIALRLELTDKDSSICIDKLFY